MTNPVSGWSEERSILEGWFDAAWAATAITAPSVSTSGFVLSFNQSTKKIVRAAGSWKTDGYLMSQWLYFNGTSINDGNKGPFKIAGFQTTNTANDTLLVQDPDALMVTQSGIAAGSAAMVVPWFPFGQVEDTPPDGSAWIEMSIVDGGGVQKTLGTPFWTRHVSMIQFTISVPIAGDSGGKAVARQISDGIDNIFTNRDLLATFGIIRCKVTDYKELGIRQNRVTGIATVPFWRDELRDVPTAVPLGTPTPGGTGIVIVGGDGISVEDGGSIG